MYLTFYIFRNFVKVQGEPKYPLAGNFRSIFLISYFCMAQENTFINYLGLEKTLINFKNSERFLSVFLNLYGCLKLTLIYFGCLKFEIARFSLS